MTFIPRSGAEALMPEEYQREIVQNVTESSVIMRMARRAPNMSRQQRRIPVLSVLPTAYFSNPGPTQRTDDSDKMFKQTSRVMWEDKYLEAEEINVIVPIPEAVLDDADYDIWSEIRPLLLEAYGLAFDQAVLYGRNAPAAWPTAIVTQAQASGNFIAEDGAGDIYDKILGEDGVVAKVEEAGFMVNGHIGALPLRAKLRQLRAGDTGVPIFKPLEKEGVQGSTVYTLDGTPVYFPQNGSVIPEWSTLISGAWNQLIYAIRKDITWKILTEAVIQDPKTGDIIYNLAQQNMVGLRSSMRLAWQVPNPINRVRPEEEDRYPFAVLGKVGS